MDEKAMQHPTAALEHLRALCQDAALALEDRQTANVHINVPALIARLKEAGDAQPPLDLLEPRSGRGWVTPENEGEALLHRVAAPALRNAISAARDFKYWLDTQPTGQAFHPDGGDARESAGYARAAASLAAAEAALESAECSQRPRQMLLLAVPVGDVVAKDGADAPASALDVFAKVTRVTGLKVIHEGPDGAEHSGFLEFRSGSHRGTCQLFELCDDELRVIHLGSSLQGCRVESAS